MQSPNPPLNAPPHPLPDLVPPAKQGIPTWVIVLIVVGVLGIPVLAGLIGTVAIIVPQMQEKQKRFTCVNNLSQLGMLYALSRTTAKQGSAPASGPALFLAWRKDQSQIKTGQEMILLCPGDPEAVDPAAPGARELFDTADLEKPERRLCSYAVRDFDQFPLDPKSAEPQVIAGCIHHKGGANLVFDDGSTRFVDRIELGLEHDEELIVGEDSNSEWLAVLRYGDGSVR